VAPVPDAALEPIEMLRVGGTWVDLSHEFGADTLYWPTAEGFSHEVDFAGMTEKGYYYSSFRISSSEHGGTHLDAPIHFAEGRRSAEAIPLNQLIGAAAVVDVSGKTVQDADYQVSVADIKAWEEQHDQLSDGIILLINTGWHRRWPQAEAYLGTAERGPDAVAKLHFPGIAPQLAAWLVRERQVAAVGIDTASIDYGQSTFFETHRTLFEQEIPAFENVANLDALPATGAMVVALPMKIKHGSGGPLRIVAWVPKAK
jgi:kynurenine formamidase